MKEMRSYLAQYSSAKIIGYGFLILLMLIISCGTFFSVDAGFVGVKYNTLTGVATPFEQGTYLKVPFIETLYDFDVRTMKGRIVAESASKDLQHIKIVVVLNFHLMNTAVDKIYVKIGMDYFDKLIVPITNECVKAASAHFPVEEIIVKRDVLKQKIEDELSKRLKSYWIELESVNLVDISFTEDFNKVVEQKQIEEQKIKTAEYMKRQAAEMKLKTILEAEAEAIKQRLLRENVNQDVIQLKWIEKWDGKLPQYMIGDKAMFMMPR